MARISSVEVLGLSSGVVRGALRFEGFVFDQQQTVATQETIMSRTKKLIIGVAAATTAAVAVPVSAGAQDAERVPATATEAEAETISSQSWCAERKWFWRLFCWDRTP